MVIGYLDQPLRHTDPMIGHATGALWRLLSPIFGRRPAPHRRYALLFPLLRGHFHVDDGGIVPRAPASNWPEVDSPVVHQRMPLDCRPRSRTWFLQNFGSTKVRRTVDRMTTPEPGLRERAKARTRHRLANVAAALFAERGYENVSIVDIAAAAEVSDQTVYNYFPAKQDLVLDRAEEIRRRYGDVIRDRGDAVTPAGALRVLVNEDIDRFRSTDPALARGEFPALCLASPTLRRFALQARDEQVETVAAAIRDTHPTIVALVARAHAAALIAIVQATTDAIGAAVLAGSPPGPAADTMQADAAAAFDELDQLFRATAGRAAPAPRRSSPEPAGEPPAPRRRRK